MKQLFFATLFATLTGASASIAAPPVAPQPVPTIGAEQTHAVRICENGSCWWSRDHYGYGGGWRRREGWYHDRDWRRDRNYDDNDWDR